MGPGSGQNTQISKHLRFFNSANRSDPLLGLGLAHHLPEITVYSDVRLCVVSDSHLQEIKLEGSRNGPSHAPFRVCDVFHRAFAESRPRIH
jgi:hypothetical protein